MATITTVSHGSYQNTPRRSYFTTSNYDTQFFGLYSNLNTTTLQTTYYLSNVQNATATVCRSNAYLRETGKKIYPGQYSGVDSYYVSVFDDYSHLTGFINPNNALFLPLNTDKPLNIINESATTGTSDDVNEGNYGPPVNTKGTINSVGYISTQSYLHVNEFALVDQYISSGTYMTAGTYLTGAVVVQGIRAAGNNPYTNQTNCDIYLNPFLGRVYTVSLPVTVTGSIVLYCGSSFAAGNAYVPPAGSVIQIIVSPLAACTLTFGGTNIVANGNVPLNGGGNYVITFTSDGTKLYETGRTGPGFTVAQTGVAAMSNGSAPSLFSPFRKLTVTTPMSYTTSKIFLTNNDQVAPGTVYSVEAVSNGSFQIVSNSSNDTSSIYWQIIN
jgi:hypothetical protein